MKKIPLTRGKVALVDDCDYEYLSQWKWCVRKTRRLFYASRSVWSPRRCQIHMHRVIAERMGLDTSETIDHRNRDSLDNRRSNLRSATQKQQSENRRPSPSTNKTGRIGVHWHKLSAKWRAQIEHNGKKVSLGLFNHFDDAVKAREEAEKKYFTHTQGT